MFHQEFIFAETTQFATKHNNIIHKNHGIHHHHHQLTHLLKILINFLNFHVNEEAKKKVNERMC